jgi:hypothetical protein
VPADEVVNHTCRHGYTSQNVVAICDFNIRFTFIVAGWPGAAYDTRILNHVLVNFHSFPMPPKNMHGTSFSSFHVSLVVLVLFILPHLLTFIRKYYLVDSGYPNRIGYLAPYKGSTYHIPNFNIVQALLKENTRCSIFCIHPFEMWLKGLLESWSRSGVFWRVCQVSHLVLKSI